MGLANWWTYSLCRVCHRHCILKFQKEVKKDDPEYIVQFMKENKGNKNVSVAIQYNRQSWVEQHTKEPLPLASTVKIIVAIAYAQQAADGHINPQQQVRLRELETFYIPKTDGGAHEAWLAQLNLNGKESVPLSEVAKGMITYSSNANTDYLMHVLGLQTINEVLTQLDVKVMNPSIQSQVLFISPFNCEMKRV